MAIIQQPENYKCFSVIPNSEYRELIADSVKLQMVEKELEEFKQMHIAVLAQKDRDSLMAIDEIEKVFANKVEALEKLCNEDDYDWIYINDVEKIFNFEVTKNE